MGRKGLQLIMDAKLQNSCHLAASTASGQERGPGLGARCPLPSSPRVSPGAPDLGRLKVLRVRPWAQARCLRGSRVGAGGLGSMVWPVPQGRGVGEGLGRGGPVMWPRRWPRCSWPSCGGPWGRWKSLRSAPVELMGPLRPGLRPAAPNRLPMRLAHVAASPRDAQGSR